MLTWLRRRARRKALLREAERLEREARGLRRSLLSHTASALGPWVALGTLAASAAVDYKHGTQLQAALTAKGDEARAATLEAEARRLRGEAGRIG